MSTNYMQHALALARKAKGNVSPNPSVGAVVVNGDKIVGEGYTQPPGSPHAEIVALKQAGETTRGATMYVTLEPCCHYGRTPPCTETIIKSGIREVHMAMTDPNPLVAGKGKAKLESAGINTYVGECEEEAWQVNEDYIKFITEKTPFVTVKFAMSLDGKIATKTFDSKWISNGSSRERVHQLRTITDAIMVGANTVVQDNPRLTARTDQGERYPLRVVVDSRGQIPPQARVFKEAGKTLIATTAEVDPAREQQYLETGAEVIKLPSRNGMVDLAAVFKVLGERNTLSVLVEGGGGLLGSLFDGGLVDKVIVFIAPVIIGGEGAVNPVAGEGVESVAKAWKLKRVEIEQPGNDIMVSGYLR